MDWGEGGVKKRQKEEKEGSEEVDTENENKIEAYVVHIPPHICILFSFLTCVVVQWTSLRALKENRTDRSSTVSQTQTNCDLPIITRPVGGKVNSKTRVSWLFSPVFDLQKCFAFLTCWSVCLIKHQRGVFLLNSGFISLEMLFLF